ncbi:zinc finger BED domain-containing 1-like protein [Labeo rohita]|uniref:Zinc finger BED domain-containing 1-like protein n=1 Tax=Labeo rohita TaxID=84645 RepID=A0A498LHL3_LABRO|nr:zinc finger BED domain-containing 1-like protein [Labeo rohita]
MIDSGAALNLTDRTTVEKYQIPIQPCTPPIKIKAINDTLIGEGITHQTKTLTLKVGLLHQESITFYIVDFPKHEAILGFPWLSIHDPDISCVDAARDDDSLGRLVNDGHANPNSRMKTIRVDGKPYLCLFAMRNMCPDNCLESFPHVQAAKTHLDRTRPLSNFKSTTHQKGPSNQPDVVRHLPSEARSKSAELWVTPEKDQLSLEDQDSVEKDMMKAITDTIAFFICKDIQPYSVTENEGFQYLLHVLEPRYHIPDRKLFTEKQIPILYDKVRREIAESLSSAQRVAITVHGWTSCATDSYITVTAHYVDDEWVLQNHVLQTRVFNEAHTGSNLAVLLQDVAAEADVYSSL